MTSWSLWSNEDGVEATNTGVLTEDGMTMTSIPHDPVTDWRTFAPVKRPQLWRLEAVLEMQHGEALIRS